MSAFSPSMRAKVVERAGHRCEYCRLPTRGQVATFPIDHVVPKSTGGTNDDRNLALWCPHCNAQKWKTADAVDPITQTTAPYFNPPEQSLGGTLPVVHDRDGRSDRNHTDWPGNNRGTSDQRPDDARTASPPQPTRFVSRNRRQAPAREVTPGRTATITTHK